MDTNQTQTASQSNQNPQPQNKPLLQNESQLLIFFRYLWQAVNIFIFIYIMCSVYGKLKINNVDYGHYLKPIASIPALLVFGAAIIIHYVLQNLEANKTISLTNAENDVLHDISAMRSQDPLRMVLRYLWKSIKITLKNFIISILLLIPVMFILDIVLSIFTGNGKIEVTY